MYHASGSFAGPLSGRHYTGLYQTFGLFSLNICLVCGSYQCPYCPFYNLATAVQCSVTVTVIAVLTVLLRYLGVTGRRLELVIL